MSKVQPDQVPDPETRRRVSLFIVLYLAFQLVVPLTYYLRSDRYDERFAWRMFSAIRMHDCQSSAVETIGRGPSAVTQNIELGRAIHPAWLSNLGRNRGGVIRAFLERRCAEPDRTEVRLVNECSRADGERVPPLEYTRDCATGQTHEPREKL